MAKFHSLKPIAAGLGLTVAAGAATLSTSASAVDNPFATQVLPAGYQLAGMEGKCGEGKCGGEKSEKEGSCGAKEKSKRDAKDAEGKCGGEKLTKEGNCGAKPKTEQEGKCGEGKCGNMN